MRAFLDFGKRRPFLFNLAIDICLGALIEFVLVPVIYRTPWPVGAVLEGAWAVRRIGDNIADSLSRLSSTIPTGHQQTTPFVFLDIDEATWKSWGSPLITPRDRLAALVKIASPLQPAAIFLDVDLSFPLAEGDTDGQLRALLADYDKKATAPLVLVRSLISTGTAPKEALKERHTVYEGGALSPKIIWSTTFFEEGPDGLVRRWRLTENVCDRGAPHTIASAELALAAIAAGKKDELTKTLARLTPTSCGAKAGAEDAKPVLDLGAGRVIRFDEEETTRRILYSLRWEEADASQATRPRFLGPMVEFRGRQTPLLTVLPAATLLEAKTWQDAPLRALFAGRIVTIGGSFGESGDIHRTPVGPMPGAVVVANAVHALSMAGTPHEPGPAERLGWSFLLVTATSLAFYFLRPAVAALVMGAFLLALMRLTLDTFRSGVALDLAVPATGVLIHRQILAIGAFLRELRKDGSSALLAKPEKE